MHDYTVVQVHSLIFFILQFQVWNQQIHTSFKKNLSDIISLVPDPIKLANDLYSEGMLAPLVRDRVIENLVSSRYEKATILMNEVERNFHASVDQNLVDWFYKLCDILEHQDNPYLLAVVEKMMSST